MGTNIKTYLHSKWKKLITARKPFQDSTKYWKERYENEGNSGSGSYGVLAEFKAALLNKFVSKENIKSIIEFGCGDGNQLSLAKYPNYIGVDVSPKAISLCKNLFKGDSSKEFLLLDNYKAQKADLTISLDVIFHLVEDHIFHEYMTSLFLSSKKYVAIYSSNTNKNQDNSEPHIRHRKFTDWINTHQPHWKLYRHTPNKYPYTGNNKTSSFSDFYIFIKV